MQLSHLAAAKQLVDEVEKLVIELLRKAKPTLDLKSDPELGEAEANLKRAILALHFAEPEKSSEPQSGRSI